jgi:hypothetical protein
MHHHPRLAQADVDSVAGNMKANIVERFAKWQNGARHTDLLRVFSPRLLVHA